ncbi:phosphatase PAP2 family protein [Vibrio maerlii]|uniref:phosphatase PAP2 family protein n=1 Tax=Vibrio maerlii TaxID=2231648 RepID=UPI000E3E8616|nr:phosphatase PAP2 family protein [Vibrio maerlii]
MRVMEPITRMDLAFLQLCLGHRFNNQVARVSKAISHTGDGHLYLFIGLAAWALDHQLGLLFLCAGLLAFALELPIYWVTKNSFRRQRPYVLSKLIPSFITPSDQYSLPSGHTAAAFLMATLTSHFYPELGVVAFVWASLIGSARILLGVHFFTDVLIGALLGSGCAQLSVSIVEAMR